MPVDSMRGGGAFPWSRLPDDALEEPLIKGGNVSHSQERINGIDVGNPICSFSNRFSNSYSTGPSPLHEVKSAVTGLDRFKRSLATLLRCSQLASRRLARSDYCRHIRNRAFHQEPSKGKACAVSFTTNMYRTRRWQKQLDNIH